MRLGANHPEIRSSDLRDCGALRPRLTHYGPGCRQSSHVHHVPHVSLVVAGSFRETTPRGERIVCQGSVGFRSEAARHSVSYGPAGALILSLETDEWISAGGRDTDILWVSASARIARELLDLISAGGPGAAGDAADRLLDISILGQGPKESSTSRPAPPWLREAADHLLAAPQEVAIGELAAHSGVHRVHFSRLFLRHYGMAPNVFRRRAMAAQALASALGQEANLADAAAHGGFADQSHMARTMRECCGMGAAEIRRLLSRQATSVQSGRAAAA